MVENERRICVFKIVYSIWVDMNTFYYIFSSFILLIIGRKLGWLCCRLFLYEINIKAMIVFVVLWGFGVAATINFLYVLYTPNIFLKLIFGFMLGLYVSIPNYGLLNESTIPPEAYRRHDLIRLVPIWSYIAVSLFFFLYFLLR